MKARKRVSSEERRELILEAVIPVFAEKGFHGATTRTLAEAAGVSEALLYKHFPSKDSLYAAIFLRHLGEKTEQPETQALLAEPPSTSKLVRLLQLMFHDIAEPHDDCLARLMAQSVHSDGAFAKTVLDTFEQNFMHFFLESIEAAHACGDLCHGKELPRLGVWFTHHLAVTFKLLTLPGTNLVDYGRSRAEVLEECLRFILRGMGFREASIDQHLPTTATPPTSKTSSPKGRSSR